MIHNDVDLYARECGLSKQYKLL